MTDEYEKNHIKVKEIKRELLKLLNESGLVYSFNGDQEYCIDSTVNLCLHGVSSEALMLSTKAYCGISNGSACTSKNYEPSYVLKAMGIPTDQIENSIRISWGADTNVNDFKGQFFKLLEIAKSLAK